MPANLASFLFFDRSDLLLYAFMLPPRVFFPFPAPLAGSAGASNLVDNLVRRSLSLLPAESIDQAFKTGDAEMVKMVLNHKSAEEDILLQQSSLSKNKKKEGVSTKPINEKAAAAASGDGGDEGGEGGGEGGGGGGVRRGGEDGPEGRLGPVEGVAEGGSAGEAFCRGCPFAPLCGAGVIGLCSFCDGCVLRVVLLPGREGRSSCLPSSVPLSCFPNSFCAVVRRGTIIDHSVRTISAASLPYASNLLQLRPGFLTSGEATAVVHCSMEERLSAPCIARRAYFASQAVRILQSIDLSFFARGFTDVRHLAEVTLLSK